MLNEQKRSVAFGVLETYFKVTKLVSADEKNMYGWIEWILMADPSITIEDNDYYRKRSNLKSTSYKAVTKHMEALLKLVQANIKRKLPATFGIICDCWLCVLHWEFCTTSEPLPRGPISIFPWTANFHLNTLAEPISFIYVRFL